MVYGRIGEEILKLGLRFCGIVEQSIEANFDVIHRNCFGGFGSKSVGRRRVKSILKLSEGFRANLAI